MPIFHHMLKQYYDRISTFRQQYLFKQYHNTMATFAQAWVHQGLQELQIAWWMEEPMKPGYGLRLCMTENAHQSLNWILARSEYSNLHANAIWFRTHAPSREPLLEKLYFNQIPDNRTHVACLERLQQRLPHMVLTHNALIPFYPIGVQWHVDHYVRFLLKKTAPSNELANIFYQAMVRHGSF
jgi:hypothetical protein